MGIVTSILARYDFRLLKRQPQYCPQCLTLLPRGPSPRCPPAYRTQGRLRCLLKYKCQCVTDSHLTDSVSTPESPTGNGIGSLGIS